MKKTIKGNKSEICDSDDISLLMFLCMQTKHGIKLGDHYFNGFDTNREIIFISGVSCTLQKHIL